MNLLKIKLFIAAEVGGKKKSRDRGVCRRVKDGLSMRRLGFMNGSVLANRITYKADCLLREVLRCWRPSRECQRCRCAWFILLAGEIVRWDNLHGFAECVYSWVFGELFEVLVLYSRVCAFGHFNLNLWYSYS